METQNRQNKENKVESPHEEEAKDEHKTGDDDHRQGVKSKPKIISGKLPSAFSNPHIKYKMKQNEQQFKQIKDAVRDDDARKNKQNTLEPLPIPIERQNKMKRALNNGNKNSEVSAKYDQMAKSQSNGFGSFKNMGSDLQINAVSTTDIKLHQMVSLALIKPSSVSGPMKMLHVPTFSIYWVKEIPMSSRDAKAQLK